MIEPIRVETYGNVAPRVRGQRSAVATRKFIEQLASSFPLCADSEGFERAREVLVEVPAWHVGIAIHRAREKASYITSVFAKECARVVFRVSLVEHKWRAASTTTFLTSR